MNDHLKPTITEARDKDNYNQNNQLSKESEVEELVKNEQIDDVNGHLKHIKIFACNRMNFGHFEHKAQQT